MLVQLRNAYECGKIMFFALAVVAVWTPAYAQTESAKPSSQAQGGMNEATPRLLKSADVTLPDGREISIHREARVDAPREGAIYFHRPLFAFVEASGENTDHPIITAKAEQDDNVFIGLRLIVSTPEFRELARLAALKEDQALSVETPSPSLRRVEVLRWPLKALRITAMHKLNGTEFGVSRVDPLRTSGDVIDVTLRVSKDVYTDFVSALKDDNVLFVPSFTFENALVAFGQRATQVSGAMRVGLEGKIASSQLAEGAPIFQDDYVAIESDLRQVVTETVRATDPQVLPLIGASDITAQILKPQVITFDDLKSNPKLQDAVMAYLTPIVDKMSASRSKEDTTENNKRNERTRKLTLGANAGTTGVGGNVEISDEDKTILEKKHKVAFKDGSEIEADVIRPHSIEVHYIQKGWQNTLFNSIHTVYLSTGRDDSFQTDTSFQASFTEKRLREALNFDQIKLPPVVSGIPLGVAVPYFGAEIPQGFVLCDGQAKWPKANWVPEHLRGTSIPDLRGAFVRGTTANPQIGKMGEQRVKIPRRDISGTAKLSKSTAKGEPYDVVARAFKDVKGDLTTVDGSHLAKVRRGGETVTETVAGQRMPLLQGDDKAELVRIREHGSEAPVTSQLDSFDVGPGEPKHVNCRWIIRLE